MFIASIAYQLGRAFGVMLPFVGIGLIVWGIVALINRLNKPK